MRLWAAKKRIIKRHWERTVISSSFADRWECSGVSTSSSFEFWRLRAQVGQLTKESSTARTASLDDLRSELLSRIEAMRRLQTEHKLQLPETIPNRWNIRSQIAMPDCHACHMFAHPSQSLSSSFVLLALVYVFKVPLCLAFVLASFYSIGEICPQLQAFTSAKELRSKTRGKQEGKKHGETNSA